MRLSLGLLAAALLVCSLAPVRAQTIYRIPRCHVYDDTAYIQIPGQCGTVAPAYPRRLFLRSSRRYFAYHCPY